jgi:hypothetical protein
VASRIVIEDSDGASQLIPTLKEIRDLLKEGKSGGGGGKSPSASPKPEGQATGSEPKQEDDLLGTVTRAARAFKGRGNGEDIAQLVKKLGGDDLLGSLKGVIGENGGTITKIGDLLGQAGYGRGAGLARMVGQLGSTGGTGAASAAAGAGASSGAGAAAAAARVAAGAGAATGTAGAAGGGALAAVGGAGAGAGGGALAGLGTAATGAAAALGPAAIAFVAAQAAADVAAKGLAAAAQAAESMGKTARQVVNDDAFGMFRDGVENAAKGLDAVSDLSPAAKVAAAGLRTATAVVNEFRETVNAVVQRGRELSRYSGELASANARADVRKLERDIAEAQALGESVGRLTDSQSRLDATFREILLPIKSILADILADLVEPVADLASIIKPFVVTLLEILKSILDAVRKLNPLNRAKDALSGIRKLVEGDEGDGTLNKIMEKFLDADGLGAQVGLTPAADRAAARDEGFGQAGGSPLFGTP